MSASDNEHNGNYRPKRSKPRIEEKYKRAIELYCSTQLPCTEISRICGITASGLQNHIFRHHRNLMLTRYGISCSKEEACNIKISQLRGQLPATTQEAADTCGVSYAGLEQHLLFYHKDLVKRRIGIREKAVRQQRKGEITGRGTVHAPSASAVKKYAEAVHLFSTTPMSAAQIAMKTRVSKKGFYEHLHKWHMDLICKRKGISYKEGKPVDWSKVRKYNPATKVKYGKAIRKLKESELPTATVAAEFGLHPDCLRQYLKEHEPELYAHRGMMKTKNGSVVSRRSMDKYGEAIHLYGTTAESLKSLARRFEVNDCSLRQFIQRNFPELIKRHKELVKQAQKKD